MKIVPVSVRDFAQPVPRTGSIEPHSGFGRSAAEGQEIHQRVQRRREKSDPLYRCEVPVVSLFDREGFRFRIEGRMDGIFLHDPPRIEEIKSAFSVGDLSRRLAVHPPEHPYALQLLTYGYFHWREHGVVPDLSFHLVSSRNGASQDLPLRLDTGLYEQWLELRLQELAAEARQAEKRSARRRRLAAAFPFPFDAPRPGQRELMDFIAGTIPDRKPLLIQAPTGLGKTVGVLHPLLEDALGRGQRLVYVTPKNSQHAVAEDAVERFRARGARLKALSLTAKGKICFKNEPLCTPEYCEYARDYYGKLHLHGIRRILAGKRSLKRRTFRELGERYGVCPFQLQMESVQEADIVICDYNYVFAPRSALRAAGEIAIDRDGKPNLVIDEVHNLPGRAIDYYSPALSASVLETIRHDLPQLDHRFRREAQELLEGCLGIIASCRPRDVRTARIEPPAELFLEQDAGLRGFLSRYLESDAEIQRNDPVLRLCFLWGEFTSLLEEALDPRREEFFTTWRSGVVKITCCDPSPMLGECYGEYEQVVGFSGTLKPFGYYAQLSGLGPERVRTAEFCSPFPKGMRKLLVIPQISTRYSRRERNYHKIADAVRRIVEVRRGNYFVFLPSFEFLDRIGAILQPPAGFSLRRQQRGMKTGEVEEILERLRCGGPPVIVLAVQGGSLSEGLDYAGDSLIGAFVVGPPLPSFDPERELMREYYQRRYGAGYAYAYTIPAMARAVQAAGRVIRSENDRGLIVLMDSRFAEKNFSSSMPADWFETSVTELVSERILEEVREFWEGGTESPGSG